MSANKFGLYEKKEKQNYKVLHEKVYTLCTRLTLTMILSPRSGYAMYTRIPYTLGDVMIFRARYRNLLFDFLPIRILWHLLLLLVFSLR